MREKELVPKKTALKRRKNLQNHSLTAMAGLPTVCKDGSGGLDGEIPCREGRCISGNGHAKNSEMNNSNEFLRVKKNLQSRVECALDFGCPTGIVKARLSYCMVLLAAIRRK